MSSTKIVAIAIAAALVVVLGVNFVMAVGPAVERERQTYLDEACAPLKPSTENARLGRLPADALDIAAQDVTGKLVPLSAYRGKVVLLNFWASWCAPCVEEMPSMDALQRASGDDLVVLAVSSDNSWDDIKGFFAQMGGTAMSVLWDPAAAGGEATVGALSRSYGTTRLPESYLIDRHGRVRYYVVNTRDWNSPDARRCVAKLLAE